MPYSKVSDLPQAIQNVLNSVGYGRKDVSVEAKEKVSMCGGGWTGQRNFFCIVDLDTGRFEAKQGSWGGANAFNPDNPVDNDQTSYPVLPNIAIVEGSSGGRGVFASVIVHPDNMAKFLPNVPSLDARDRWILYTFKALTSPGRKDEWRRCADVPSEADLNRLASAGYLKRSKNGATQITTEGKNALGLEFNCQSISHPSRE